MSRTLLKQQINKLLSGASGYEQLYYYEGSYKVIESGQLTEISRKQAEMFMKAGSHLIHIVEDTRQWDDKLDAFVGPEPVHEVLPEVPKAVEVMRVTCAFPPKEAAEIFIE
ncbi:MAG TPA: hypothetical protein PKM59_10030 [Thermodesulfobacteriota bacterium]|nr:hypothetical protein [Thermodesulfobacteriota bacterium]